MLRTVLILLACKQQIVTTRAVEPELKFQATALALAPGISKFLALAPAPKLLGPLKTENHGIIRTISLSHKPELWNRNRNSRLRLRLLLHHLNVLAPDPTPIIQHYLSSGSGFSSTALVATKVVSFKNLGYVCSYMACKSITGVI